MLAHYERFETLGDPADREAAQHWLKAERGPGRAERCEARPSVRLRFSGLLMTAWGSLLPRCG